MKLTVTAEIGRAWVPFVRKHTLAAFGALRRRRAAIPLRDLTVALIGDRRMIDLHAQFMNLPTTTDVLTFPIDLDERGRAIVGEVYVCVPEGKRRATELGSDPKLECLLYAVHGMLHLLGYDDRTDRAYRIMHRTEDAILERLGFGPVFAPKSAVKFAAASRKRWRVRKRGSSKGERP